MASLRADRRHRLTAATPLLVAVAALLTVAIALVFAFVVIVTTAVVNVCWRAAEFALYRAH